MSTVIDLEGCARCGGDRHPQLEFREFIRPANLGGLVITHWALCPMTGEPIMLQVINDDVEKMRQQAARDALTEFGWKGPRELAPDDTEGDLPTMDV